MITADTKIREINNALFFSLAKDKFITGNFMTEEIYSLSLRELQEQNETWYCEDIVYGLRNLQGIAESGTQFVYGIYPNNASEVQMFYVPAQNKKTDTYVILLGGGGYGAVCTMVEALPVAAKLNELGFHCFCLNYRVAEKETFSQGLFPKPLDDLAAAVRYIHENAKTFGVGENYIVCGFSAGGHLASMWGTAHVGARKYGIRQPQMLMLDYPLVTMELVPDSPIKAMLCTGMFGEDYSVQDMETYDASKHIDRAYPKTYLVRSTDDLVVTVEQGDRLLAALAYKKISCKLEEASDGGHGFGLGSATPLRGWVERGIEFFENN